MLLLILLIEVDLGHDSLQWCVLIANHLWCLKFFHKCLILLTISQVSWQCRCFLIIRLVPKLLSFEGISAVIRCKLPTQPFQPSLVAAGSLCGLICIVVAAIRPVRLNFTQLMDSLEVFLLEWFLSKMWELCLIYEWSDLHRQRWSPLAGASCRPALTNHSRGTGGVSHLH